MQVMFQQVCVATQCELQDQPELLEEDQHQLHCQEQGCLQLMVYGSRKTRLGDEWGEGGECNQRYPPEVSEQQSLLSRRTPQDQWASQGLVRPNHQW